MEIKMPRILHYIKKHALFILIWFGLLWLVSYETYAAYVRSNIVFDTNTYAQVIIWVWKIERDDEKILLNSKNPRELLYVGDVISTISYSSLLVVEWWDWSITRLWWWSKILINEASVSEDLTNVKVDFTLESWKTWSNVVTTIWEESYFNQNFDTYVAWVRGTVYEVNLEEDYVYVSDHQINMSDTSSSDNSFNLSSWSVFSISLLEYLDEKARDLLWGTLNETLDNEYIVVLREKMDTYFENIKSAPSSILSFMDDTNKVVDIVSWELSSIKLDDIKDNMSSEMQDALYSAYQKYNFTQPWEEWYEIKNKLRELLLASWENNKNIEAVESTIIYDLEDSIKSWNIDATQTLVTYLSSSGIDIESYKDYLWTIDWKWDAISAEMKSIISDNFDYLKSSFNVDMLNDFNLWWIESIKDSLDKVNLDQSTIDNLKNTSQQWLNDLFNSANNLLNK